MLLLHIFDQLAHIACCSSSVVCVDSNYCVRRYTFFMKAGFNRLHFRASPAVFYWYYPFDPSIIGTCTAPLIGLNGMLPNHTNLLGFDPNTCLYHQSRLDCHYMQYVRSRYTLPYFLLHFFLLATPSQHQQHVSACCSSCTILYALRPVR